MSDILVNIKDYIPRSKSFPLGSILVEIKREKDRKGIIN